MRPECITTGGGRGLQGGRVRRRRYLTYHREAPIEACFIRTFRGLVAEEDFHGPPTRTSRSPGTAYAYRRTAAPLVAGVAWGLLVLAVLIWALPWGEAAEAPFRMI